MDQSYFTFMYLAVFFIKSLGVAYRRSLAGEGETEASPIFENRIILALLVGSRSRS
jgi:hypothetical protein